MDFKTDDLEKGQKGKKVGRGLFLTNRQVSWTLSFFIFTWFFVFISGYFLGKKKAAEKFYNKMSQESLSDHIYYSVCSIYDNNENCEKQESTEDSSEDIQKENESNEDLQHEPQTVVSDATIQAGVKAEAALRPLPSTTRPAQGSGQQEKLKKEETAESTSCDTERYYAELIGFGTFRAAHKFVEKLKQQDFSVVLKKRKSKTSKGKIIVWYQVVTEKFDNKNDLIAFVDILKDKEKLKGVHIIQC